MKITDEQIMEAADKCSWSSAPEGYYGFLCGVQWASEQMRGQWISVKDRLPDDKQDVWVCNVIKGWGPALFYYDEIENLFIEDYWNQIEPENTTHWMVADVPDLPNRNNN